VFDSINPISKYGPAPE